MQEEAKKVFAVISTRVSSWWESQPYKLIIGALLFLFLISSYVFIELADKVTDGQTQQFDEWCLQVLRQPDDPALPLGPSWLREAFMDATALGSPLFLLLTVFSAVGFLAIQGRNVLAYATFLATGGGGLLVLVLKYVIGRPRPTVVPHLREVTTPGFPSGHAMLSAIVFLSIGVILAQSVRSFRAKAYFLLWAFLLAILVGASRVYLGVHYPTDILGGWLAGLAWAVLVWMAVPIQTHSPQTSSLGRKKTSL
jgi:undecaprenyl-diphosphatase